jgi:hypothetical protein
MLEQLCATKQNILARKETGKEMKKLTPALEAEYKMLKQQVDFWMEAWAKKDASPSAKQRYWYAKQDLTKFVSNRRKEGYTI